MFRYGRGGFSYGGYGYDYDYDYDYLVSNVVFCVLNIVLICYKVVGASVGFPNT